MTSHRRSICCILPPQVLENIARNGNAEQREWALDTLATDQSLRSIRAQNALIAAAAPKTIQAHATAAGAPVRTIFDCHHTEDPVRAPIVRNEGADPIGDVTANEAYDGLGATYKLYYEAYERDSIDDAGMPLKGYVHYGDSYDNAFWDGQEMIFGDGDGRIFDRFTISVDIIGHELTHGVTEHEAGLAYIRQSGALNESISDVFGSIVKQYQHNQKADEADWLIGAGLIIGHPDQALRSMKAPGTAYDNPLLGRDDQPATMAGYVVTTKDNGGVHTNSGIPNHAFYLAAVNIGGYAWERAGRIWYETLRDPRLPKTAQFKTFARATLRAAVRLGFGDASNEYKAVRQAWAAVGLNV